MFSPSRAPADSVESLQGVAAKKIRLLPWALDPDFETIASTFSSKLPDSFPSGPVILSVGRWLATERYKGMDTLIRALPRLLLRWPSLQLALVGSGDDHEWSKPSRAKVAFASMCISFATFLRSTLRLLCCR